MKTLGYAQHGPQNGIGPFKALFNRSINLRYAKDLSECDAIVLWGGEDISPSLYEEERFRNSGPAAPSARDTFEWELINMAVSANIPIIGVCRGAQMLCAYAGGKLIQDVDGHGNGSHMITTDEGGDFLVTSCHHQMMYPFDINHKMLAWSKVHRSTHYNPQNTAHSAALDKHHVVEPEVVYFPDIKGFGVQCHPEWHFSGPELQFNTWMMGRIKELCFSTEQQEC